MHVYAVNYERSSWINFKRCCFGSDAARNLQSNEKPTFLNKCSGVQSNTSTVLEKNVLSVLRVTSDKKQQHSRVKNQALYNVFHEYVSRSDPPAICVSISLRQSLYPTISSSALIERTRGLFEFLFMMFSLPLNSSQKRWCALTVGFQATFAWRLNSGLQ